MLMLHSRLGRWREETWTTKTVGSSVRFTRLWQCRPPPPGTSGGRSTSGPPRADSPSACGEGGDERGQDGGRVQEGNGMHEIGNRTGLARSSGHGERRYQVLQESDGKERAKMQRREARPGHYVLRGEWGGIGRRRTTRAMMTEWVFPPECRA